MDLEDRLSLTPIKNIPIFKEAFLVARAGVPGLDIRDVKLDAETYVSNVLRQNLPKSLIPANLYIGDKDAINCLMDLHSHPKAYTSPFNSPTFDPNSIGLTCPRLTFGYEIGNNEVYLVIGRSYAKTPFCHH
ncbi:MAG: hypothetical protein QXE31_04025 [Candidatus Woesearchaeota archaeon]